MYNILLNNTKAVFIAFKFHVTNIYNKKGKNNKTTSEMKPSRNWPLKNVSGEMHAHKRTHTHIANP